jgi:hypothetical protein
MILLNKYSFSIIINPATNRRYYMPVKFILPSHIQVGSKINGWTLLELPIMGRDKILCRCDCGKEMRVNTQNILRGLSKRCRSCSIRNRSITHGESDHTGNTRLYRIWKAMKWRCNPKNTTADHKMYYERGVRVCAEWENDYIAFRDWALSNGYADNLSIDRYPDLNGGYNPANCRWATQKQQCRNTKANHYLEAFGERKTVTEWSEDSRCMVTGHALKRRIVLGWSPENAITYPAIKVPYRIRKNLTVTANTNIMQE